MKDQPPGVLTESQRQAMQTACNKCGSARRYLDYLDKLGMSDQDLRDRVDHAEKLARRALEIDGEARQG